MAPTDTGHPRSGHTLRDTERNTTPQHRCNEQTVKGQKQKEHACLIHNLPFQRVHVGTTHRDPQPPRSIPHTPRRRN